MPSNHGQAVEDYLKTIYEIAGPGGKATTNQLAERLGVRPASVTGMLQKLAANEPPLVQYVKHHGAELTSAGERVALEMIRHHRLLELYLHNALGYTWDEVHGEADELEHVISEKFEERIARALDDPLQDPHGEPIPSVDLRLPAPAHLTLSALRPGQRAVIEWVVSGEPELLRHLAGLGLTPQARLRVHAYSPFDDTMQVEIAGRTEMVTVGKRITSQVYVVLLAEVI